MVNNIKSIEEISKDWKLTTEERRHLFKTCARVLDESNEV